MGRVLKPWLHQVRNNVTSIDISDDYDINDNNDGTCCKDVLLQNYATITTWNQKINIPISKFRIYGGMTKPAFLFDGRKILDHDVRNLIFKVQFQNSIWWAFKLPKPIFIFDRINFWIMIIACPNQDWLVKWKKIKQPINQNKSIIIIVHVHCRP